MAKPFKNLRDKMSPESRDRAHARALEMLAEMPLQELRQARQMSQKNLATVLCTGQPAISKIEHQTDVYVSTLRSYLEAMGGELEIVARFRDGTAVRIRQFKDIEPEHEFGNTEPERGNLRRRRA